MSNHNFKPGDYVSVKMREAHAIMIQDENGVWGREITGYTDYQLADVVHSLHGDDVVCCDRAGAVGVDQLVPASAAQIAEVDRINSQVAEMINAGDALMNRLQEPEYL